MSVTFTPSLKRYTRGEREPSTISLCGTVPMKRLIMPRHDLELPGAGQPADPCRGEII